MANEVDPIRAAKMFEFYVRTIWPYHRTWVGNKVSQRCRICVTSEHASPLDQTGLCAQCRDTPKTKKQKTDDFDKPAQDDFARLLQEHEGKGEKQYDALVAFSGGKDSLYMIRRVQNEFPQMRILAFTVDNGFMSSVAKDNIDIALPKLNVDHIFVRPHRDFYVKLFRYTITHLNDNGGYGTVDFSDGEFMLDCARNIAAERQIPLILVGYSRYQVEDGLKLNHFEAPRAGEHIDRTETAGLALKNIFNEAEQKLWWQASKWPKEHVARLLFPMFAWNLEENTVKQQVVKWGLMGEKTQSPIVTNHQLIPLLGVVDVHRKGYSSYEKELCRMVREGKADRREWLHVFEFLEYTAKTGMFLKTSIHDLLAQLDLQTSDVGITFNS